MSLATFKGGIHPPDRKELSKGAALVRAKVPKTIVIPLSQHIGAPCSATVEIGQEVKMGQVVGKADAFVSAPVHSSVSGKVVAIGQFPNAMGRMVPSVVIENDGQDTWAELQESADYINMEPDAIKAKISDAGIVGMGGATFPASVKLSPPKEKPIDTLILNGAECEPYLNADYRLMIERPSDVLEGLKILMKLLGVEKGYVGIESNKPDAVEIMGQAARGTGIKVVDCEVKYPQGAEKMLIKAITGREVPSKGGLPMDVGSVVHNVGTAVAIFEAVRYGRPLIERVVSVTGKGINEPRNLLVRVGTMISEVIDECGGLTDDCVKVVSGGPMMGFAMGTLEMPVTKGTSGILCMVEGETEGSENYGPCIRCGRCIDACPMYLMPQMLSILSEAGFYEECKEYNLFDCFECGSCTYVCPAKRPIVQFVRLAKSQTKPG
jgi:electron transport complex protein RnfC